MRLVRFLIYALAALIGLYVLAAVLYAIPMIGGKAWAPSKAEVRGC